MRRLVLAALVAVAALPACGRDDDATRTLRDAAAWLWSRQRDDGSWASEQYAVLRSGQALTPYVLHALLQVPSRVAPRPAGGVERALAFLRAQVNEDGAVGYGDPDLHEYPVYATAYTLRCLVRAGGDADRALVLRVADWLAAQQFRASNGFPVGSLAHGGFGFGEVGLGAGDAGHTDVSHTRRALEALGAAGRLDASAAEAALVYLDRVRHPSDGGFHYSPLVYGANKGGQDEDGTPRSYATATCDGVLALLAAGLSSDDDRIVRARRWLGEHPHLTYPEGIPGSAPWGPALFYTHLSVRARVAAAFGADDGTRSRVVDLLRARQDRDGSFTNRASPLQKEDEPLLATAHAVIALSCGVVDPSM